MHVFVFPGQGSQKRGMGDKLFDEIPQFASAEREVDELLVVPPEGAPVR